MIKNGVCGPTILHIFLRIGKRKSESHVGFQTIWQTIYSRILVLSLYHFHSRYENQHETTVSLRFLASLICLSGFSQEAKRYVLIEHFTNTRCSICSFRNPAFFEAIAPHEQDVHHIAYHPSFPYSSCVFYQHNTTENQARATYYTVPGTPTTYLWGSRVSNGSSLLPGNSLANALNQTSPIEVLVSEQLSGAGRSATIEVKTRAMLPENGDYRLFAAVVERRVQYAAPNGEDEHHNVFRKMLPGSDGESFSPASPGGSISFTYSYDFDSEWDLTQIYVIAFVQDMGTKEVLNSGSTLDVVATTAIDEELDQQISVFPNPASSTFQIAWEDVQASQMKAKLFSPAGQLVLAQSSASPRQQMKVDVSGISAGLYFLQVEAGDRYVMRKIVVE